MYKFQASDIAQNFASAKNANAALKHFLKGEAKRGDKSERFIKRLRGLSPFKNHEQLCGFVEGTLPEFETHWIVLTRYAHGEALAKVVEQIFNQYAEPFNATYIKEVDGVKIKDQIGFEGIVGKVLNSVPDLLKSEGLSSDGFMRNVVLFLTFDQEVLKHVSKRVSQVDQSGK